MNTVTTRMVYIGRRLVAGQQLTYWHQEISLDGTLGAAKGAVQPFQAGTPVGAVLEVRQPEGEPSKVYYTGLMAPRVVDAWKDPADVAQWRARDLADAQAAATARRARDELAALPDAFEQALEILREHFSVLPVMQRAALLPLVQARILGSDS
ncbi:hypothetical protein [Microbacterium xylanilyticum]